MAQNKYSNIGKKDIINVISKLIHRIDSIEVALNMFIKFIDKDDKFGEYMKQELGGKNEERTDEHDNIGGDTPEDKSSS